MIDAMVLARIVFSGLSALVIEDVEDAGGVIRVRARTPGDVVRCPGCGTGTARVHGYHERTLADVPVDGRRVSVVARLRRMRCPVLGCEVQTFREQVPGVITSPPGTAEPLYRTLLATSSEAKSTARSLQG
jgi:transposase